MSEKKDTHNAIHWFELFVSDLDRASRFYQTLLGIELRRELVGGLQMAVFPYENGRGIGGALVRDEKQKPGSGGTLVYLNASGQLDAAIERVPRAGGSVVLPKTDIGAPGFIALVRDSEGNLVGLHSER
jgi:predicted enzyme related to lactoylglutathione lyase